MQLGSGSDERLRVDVVTDKRKGASARPSASGVGRERHSFGSTELLYGRNAVREALRGPRRIHRVLLSEGVRQDDRLQEIAALAQKRGATLVRISRDELVDRAGPVNHQGVAAETGPYLYADADALGLEPGVIVALDHLQDPQNVGTLIRSALAFSAAGILMPSDRSAEVTPAVVNASAGATEHLAIARVTNLARQLDRLKAAGRWIIGLDTGQDAVSLAATRLPLPAVLVVGAEGPGIGRLVRERCDVVVAIPISEAIDSLNAATAASIALFELERQRLTLARPE